MAKFCKILILMVCLKRSKKLHKWKYGNKGHKIVDLTHWRTPQRHQIEIYKLENIKENTIFAGIFSLQRENNHNERKKRLYNSGINILENSFIAEDQNLFYRKRSKKMQ